MSALPTAFLILAEAAITADGRDPGVPVRLINALRFVEPVLTLDNLANRNNGLAEAALRYIETRSGRSPEDEDRAIGTVMDAVEIGVVAGFLIARMLDGKDGAA